MLGSIIGDILGSVHEKIPGMELRKEYQMTDDSYLTLAALDWMKYINLGKFKYLYDTELNSEDWKFYENSLVSQAEFYLRKWHGIGTPANQWTGCSQQSQSIPIFSPGFEAWVKSKNSPTVPAENTIKHKGNTNGCLMRNSPIAYYGHSHGLMLKHILKLTEIFCSTTHSHPDSLNATRLHSTILYKIFINSINAQNIKTFLNSDVQTIVDGQPPILFSDINIQPLEYWIPTEEKLAQNPKLKFIWDAKNSLDIACSAIYYSKSFQETIDFCNATQMDTDTYAAIAGPIAEALWGIDEANKEIGLTNIYKVPHAWNLLELSR